MAKTNSKNGKSVKKLSCLEAAYKVLAQCHGKLNPKALAAKMIAKGLWATTGATPHQTVAAGMNVEIAKKGDAARFKRVGPALFAANVTGKK